MLFSAFGLYRSRTCNLRSVEYSRIARACFVLSILLFALADPTGSNLSSGATLLGASLTFVFAVVFRSGYRSWVTGCRRRGRFLRSVLLVGTGDEAAEIAEVLRSHGELGYRVAGTIGDQGEAEAFGLGELWRGGLDAAADVLGETRATGAIICASDLRSVQLNRVVTELLNVGAHLQLSSGLRSVDIGRLRPAPLAGEPLFYVEPMSLAAWQLAAKRAIDLGLASAILVVMAPILAIAALGIKLADGGPVIFKQRRVGRDGRTFVLYKLRTMREGAEAEASGLRVLNVRDGPLLKVAHDPRVTSFGRILRATSIDELPQLWNVLSGTMSLVGPRPALPDEAAAFDEELRAREAVRPGITGLWQVEGRDNPSFAAYRRFDLFYLHNWCVSLDLMILLITVESVVGRLLHGLRNLDEDIPLVPPDLVEPRPAPVALERGQPTAS